MHLKNQYKRIVDASPKTGVVRLLRITEKQYSTIYILTGSINYQESPLKLTDIL